MWVCACGEGKGHRVVLLYTFEPNLFLQRAFLSFSVSVDSYPHKYSCPAIFVAL